MIAVGLFVAALVAVGVLLLSGGRDDNDPNIGAINGTATATSAERTPIGGSTSTTAPTQQAVPGTPSPTTAAPSATSPVPVAPTSTPDAVEPTATEDEGSAEDEPTTEPEPELEPTATDEPVEEPTPEPAIGDFGELPAAQIVSGGLARDVVLSYELGMSPDAAPTSGTAYRLYWAGWTDEAAASVASKVGITADVVGDSGSYEVISDEGQLYISRTVVQYVNTRAPVGGLLEDNATVIENARIWLLNSGITAGDIGPGSLIGRDDAAQRAVILFKPVSPSPLLAFYPSATVTTGPGGDVREANIRWPDGYDASDYGMRTGNQIWNDVLAGYGSLEADLSEAPGSGPISAVFTAYSASIAYSFAVGSDGSEYLVPLIVYEGELYATDYDVTFPARVYVQGVYAQSTPRG